MDPKIDYELTGKLSPDLRLEIDFVESIARVLEPIVGIPLDIHITKHYKRRTSKQNRWVHGAVESVRKQLKDLNGECPSHDGLYAFFRRVILGQQIRMEIIDGREIFILEGKHFSEMNTVEFGEAMEKVIKYYAEMGIQVPIPKDDDIHFINTLRDEWN